MDQTHLADYSEPNTRTRQGISGGKTGSPHVTARCFTKKAKMFKKDRLKEADDKASEISDNSVFELDPFWDFCFGCGGLYDCRCHYEVRSRGRGGGALADEDSDSDSDEIYIPTGDGRDPEGHKRLRQDINHTVRCHREDSYFATWKTLRPGKLRLTINAAHSADALKEALARGPPSQSIGEDDEQKLIAEKLKKKSKVKPQPVKRSNTPDCFGLPWDVTENIILWCIDYPTLHSLCQVYYAIYKHVHQPEAEVPGTELNRMLMIMLHRTCAHHEKYKDARLKQLGITKNKYSTLDKMKWIYNCLPDSHPCSVISTLRSQRRYGCPNAKESLYSKIQKEGQKIIADRVHQFRNYLKDASCPPCENPWSEVVPFCTPAFQTALKLYRKGRFADPSRVTRLEKEFAQGRYDLHYQVWHIPPVSSSPARAPVSERKTGEDHRQNDVSCEDEVEGAKKDDDDEAKKEDPLTTGPWNDDAQTWPWIKFSRGPLENGASPLEHPILTSRCEHDPKDISVFTRCRKSEAVFRCNRCKAEVVITNSVRNSYQLSW